MAKIRFPHPGEILEKEFLEPMGISAYKLAKAIDVPQSRISKILAGERAVTADTGLRLSKFFGMTEGFWVGLQIDYDMNAARDELGKKLEKIETYHAEAA